jgi:hypothetical protein
MVDRSVGEHHRMKKIIVSVLALGFAASTGMFAQNTSSTTSSTTTSKHKKHKKKGTTESSTTSTTK